MFIMEWFLNRGRGLFAISTWTRLGLAFGISCSVTMADTPGTPRKLADVGAAKLEKARSPQDNALGTAGLLEASPPRAVASTEEKDRGSAPVAAARFEGMVTEGNQIRLLAEGSTGPALRYRWHQTSGPAAELIDPDRATARVKIPEGASTLGFLLVVSNAQGMDSIPLTIPVEERPEAGSDGELRASAGDDQVGFVGRQITLNGGRSEPRGKVGYRWIQVGGPKVRLKIARDHYFSFVPAEPGEHRFALVVAAGSAISEPDEVVISIDYAPTRPARTERVTRPSTPPEGSELLSRFVETAIGGLDGGPAVAGSLAQVFQDVSGRIGLFRSYDETFSEISRRLDALVPQDAGPRAQWIERFFGPITTRLVEELRKEGLDLTTASGRSSPLTEAQKVRMADVFRAIAEGSRNASRTQ
jgi:hypothetical protein